MCPQVDGVAGVYGPMHVLLGLCMHISECYVQCACVSVWVYVFVLCIYVTLF